MTKLRKDAATAEQHEKECMTEIKKKEAKWTHHINELTREGAQLSIANNTMRTEVDEKKYALEKKYQERFKEAKQLKQQAEVTLLHFANTQANIPHAEINQQLALEIQKAVLDLEKERSINVEVLNTNHAIKERSAENQKLAKEKIRILEEKAARTGKKYMT